MQMDRNTPRRAWLAAAWAISAWALAGCAAPPAPPPAPAAPPVDDRAQQLKALGFRSTPDGWEFSLNGKLLFESDSDTLDAETQATAERLGRQLAKLEVTRVRVEGHTDSTGSQAYNQALSLRRAQAVARAMAAAGLGGADIRAVGLGKEAPLNDNRTPEQRQQNRRVAVVLPAQ
ncbi:OmpA family protein [Pseudorhodoferax sp.]|uniref:OmpA family protein n=1 Tax=Pseudorhodoferax sp. TaxID=1993553 RepID=UPI002DD62C85|nr:OmpA family protein [Pseudorhodoferax sp.]